MAITFKPECQSTPLVTILMALSVVYADHGLVATVTALRDGKHKAGSLHYADRAVDVRTRGIPGQPDPCPGEPSATVGELMRALRLRLGGDYQVLFESDIDGLRVQHIHIQYRPSKETP